MSWCDFGMQSVIYSVRQVCSALHQLPVLQLNSQFIHNRMLLLQFVLKSFNAESIDWQDVILWFGKDSGITSQYNDSGQYFFHFYILLKFT